MLKGDAYGEGADLWGVGCVAYELMGVEPLWRRRGLLSVAVLTDPVRPESLPNCYSVELRKVLHSTVPLRNSDHLM